MESLPCEKRVKQHKGIENESIEVDDEGFVVVVRREDDDKCKLEKKVGVGKGKKRVRRDERREERARRREEGGYSLPYERQLN